MSNIAIYNGPEDPENCIGFVRTTASGFEALDTGEVPLGAFADMVEAANVLLANCLGVKVRSNGGTAPLESSDEPHPMLDAALACAKQHGWKSFPARMEDGKKYSWLSKEHAPGGENWGMTNDPEQLRRNFFNKKWRHLCGVGIPTGWVNRIFDIEADTKEAHGADGLASLSALEAKYGRLPDTLMAESPTGSPHRIYRHPGQGIKVISRGLPGYPGIDIKGDGGMFVAPPSVRGDGQYKWLNDLPIADAPQWLIDLVVAASKGKGGNDRPEKAKPAGAFNGAKVSAAFAHLDPNKNLGEGIPVEAPIEQVRAAFAVIPNDDRDWDGWNKCGLALFRATGGSDDGLAVFHEWSSKSKEKYDAQVTSDRWADYKTCPPDRIGAGSIFYWANEASPDWEMPLQVPPEPLPPDHSFVDIYAEFAGPPFPLDTLPPTLAAFVNAQHRNTGADPSALAMAALACVAGATHAETMVLAGESWWERPILWVFLIGLPSMKKTPIVKKTMKPLVLIDHERRKTGKQEYAAWKQAQQAQQGEQKKEKLPPPRLRPRCIIRDITPEKVAEILSRDSCGSMLVRDELAGWIANFERYNSDARSFYLETWDGGTYGKDRVGRGARDEDAEIHIDNLALCILGGIQPDKLVALGDLTSDGLLQRGLPCLMQAAQRGDQYYSVAEVEAAYDKLLKSINGAAYEKYLFDPDALKIRDRVNDKLFELEQLDGFSDALIGAIGKLNGYFARICLVLEVTKQHDPANAISRSGGEALAKAKALLKADGPSVEPFGHLENKNLGAGIVGPAKRISRETTEAAERILDQFLKPHIFGLYDVIVNGGQDRNMLRAIGDFILSSPKDRLLPSDLTKGVRALRGQPDHKIREWAGRFDAMGWLQPEATRPGVPTKAWQVVPGLREHFAKRVRQAGAARAAAHEIMKAGGKQKPAAKPAEPGTQ